MWLAVMMILLGSGDRSPTRGRTIVGSRAVDIRPLHLRCPHFAPARVLERSNSDVCQCALFQQRLYRAFVGVRPFGALSWASVLVLFRGRPFGVRFPNPHTYFTGMVMMPRPHKLAIVSVVSKNTIQQFIGRSFVHGVGWSD
jgi:hypothetical protein